MRYSAGKRKPSASMTNCKPAKPKSRDVRRVPVPWTKRHRAANAAERRSEQSSKVVSWVASEKRSIRSRLQFRRRLDRLYPFCRIAGHSSEEVREILAALETVYREPFPQLNLRQWSGAIYTWLTHPLLDPTSSGRVVMDYVMKLVTTTLEWSYEAGETDVRAETLQAAAELLTLRRDAIRVIDGAGEASALLPLRQHPERPAEEETIPNRTVSLLLIWDGLAFLHRDQLTQTYLFASPFGFPRLPDLQEMSIRVKEEGAGLLSPIERWGDKLRSARAE